ncbi:hypothetical protein [Enterococcus sp.]|uniref:hypothetical protein n=1 Tax=Enterococcus sp. TaxID=35783 RepID=UPI0005E3A0EE|nr:hypothetical protein [Enterococcus sp.]COJ58297.1 Uncharacterised protein [Streptococcus pneumoniae]
MDRVETNGTLSYDYGIVKSIENRQSDLDQLAWNRKVRTSFSIEKTNVDTLHAKAISELLDTLIEKGYDDFI